MKIFHHNDMDGRAAANIIIEFYANNNPEGKVPFTEKDFIEVNYDSSKPSASKIDNGEEVYIVDYSFTESTVNDLLEIIEKSKNVHWIDHHKTSVELIDNYEKELSSTDGIISADYCGAYLTWLYFYGEKRIIPHWLELVDDWDCHKIVDTETLAFNYAMKSIDQRPFKGDIWFRLNREENLLPNIISAGKIILDFVKREDASYRNSFGYESSYEDKSVFVVNKRCSSQLFGDYMDKYDICISAVFNGTKWQYTAFSNKVDCSVIAKKYGGGGHAGAAGFYDKKMLFPKKKNK